MSSLALSDNIKPAQVLYWYKHSLLKHPELHNAGVLAFKEGEKEFLSDFEPFMVSFLDNAYATAVSPREEILAEAISWYNGVQQKGYWSINRKMIWLKGRPK